GADPGAAARRSARLTGVARGRAARGPVGGAPDAPGHDAPSRALREAAVCRAVGPDGAGRPAPFPDGGRRAASQPIGRDPCARHFVAALLVGARRAALSPAACLAARSPAVASPFAAPAVPD